MAPAVARALVRRVPLAVGSAAVGAGTGIAVVALHDWWWGLALGTVTTLVTALAFPPGWGTRLVYALGWDAMVGWLTLPRPEGDYVISADTQGYAVLGLGLVLLVLCVGTLPRPAGRIAAGGTGAGTGRSSEESAARGAGTAPAR